MSKLKGCFLAILLLSLSMVGTVSAHNEVQPVTIRFTAAVGDLPVACGMTYTGVGTEGSQVTLNDFRFYISNVRLIDKNNDETPVDLAQDGMWQYENVALLDFEDGTAGCGEAGNPEMNNRIVGNVSKGSYTGIAFDLGVPFELNHLDTTTAPAPLNIPAMWWNWQLGYKFIRVDMLTAPAAIPSWLVHVGSTGCEAANSNSAPTEPCSNTNVVSVRLDNFNPSTNFIVADLGELLTNVNLNENTPEPPGCMSMSEDPDCEKLFAGFGLDVKTGTMIEGDLQTFFKVKGETFDIMEVTAGQSGMNMGQAAATPTTP